MPDSEKQPTGMALRLLFAIILLAVVAALAWMLWTRNRTEEKITSEPAEAPAAAAASPSPTAPSSPKAPGPAPTMEDQRAFHPPTSAEVRQQVHEDPHHTPPAMIEFAREMARQMEEARKSPRSARRLFEQLEDCVLEEGDTDSPSPEPVRALCLSNAEQLSKAFPSQLQDKYESLRGKAPPQVLRLLRAMDIQ